MHTVVETPSFIAAAKAAGMSDITRSEVVAALATNPKTGELMEGTGGFRKFRFARPGQGKRSGFRVISYFHSVAMPVFLITVFSKNQKSNLTRDERNALAAMSATLIRTYSAKGRPK